MVGAGEVQEVIEEGLESLGLSAEHVNFQEGSPAKILEARPASALAERSSAPDAPAEESYASSAISIADDD